MYDANDVTDDKLLGKLDIPVKVFDDEAPKIFNFVSNKASQKQKNPNFSITLSRAFINEPPPLHKTFFLIRHGESKWNLAQSKINITGMLDRDHALTEEGINQARELNARWKEARDEVHDPTPHLSTKSSQHLSLELLERADELSEPVADLTPAVDSNKTVEVEETNYATGDLLGDFDDEAMYEKGRGEDTSCRLNNWELEAAGEVLVPSSPAVLNLEPLRMLTPTKAEQQANTQSELDTLGDVEITVHDHDVEGEEGETPAGDWRPRPSLGGAWDEEGDQSRSTAAIIDDFHATNLDFQSSPKSTSLFLNAVTEHAPARPDEDEFVRQRREEYINLFKHADKIYSSPLTRAIQTAYVSMEGHHALEEDGLTLYSLIREVKRIGGLDTVGIEYGDAIKRRVRTELKAILGKARTDELMGSARAFHVNDADQPWWTAISSYENETQQQDRVREFLSFVRHCDAQLPIFVGHSLFFKAFYSKRISTVLLNNRPDTSANLKKFRLSNASLLAVTVSFIDDDGSTDALITDADLIFGGGFHGAHVVDEDECDEREDGQAASSPQLFSITENIKDRLKQSNLPHDLKSGKDALRKGVQLLSSKLTDFFEK
eukprot:gene21476-27511_t